MPYTYKKLEEIKKHYDVHIQHGPFPVLGDPLFTIQLYSLPENTPTDLGNFDLPIKEFYGSVRQGYHFNEVVERAYQYMMNNKQ